MPVLFNNVRVVPSVDVGSGGYPFLFQPPQPSAALIGFAIRAGSWIDQIVPIFAELLEDGSTGAEQRGPAFGGAGGHTTTELKVQPGHVVTGLQTRSGTYVDAIRLYQTRWDGTQLVSSESSWTHWAGAPGMGGVERAERMAEPIGIAVAVGIAGRAGGYLDNLTLVAGELVRVTGQPLTRQISSGRNTRQTTSA